MSVKFLREHKSISIVIIIVLIAIVPHAINMFGYPYYEDDEGTYMAQAKSLVTQGKLAPYTYWYDHAPVGWLQIGIWSTLTGGIHTFDFSINSGRVFMLVLHVMSSLLLLGISRKLFKSDLPALIAVLVFSFSPLAIHYQRRVLLDNIMTFWMLMSLFLVLGEKRKLVHYAGSAIAFGIGFLSKESIVYLTPAMLFIVFTSTRKYRTLLPVILWVMLVGIVIAYYPLYALLQGELFPSGTVLGGSNPHVSLLGSLSFQNGRAGGFFMNPDSDFMTNWRGWNETDAILMISGIFANACVALLSIRKANLRPIALLTLFYWYFLMRGGIVIAFYIVPLIPLLALCIGAIAYYAVILVNRPMKSSYLRYTTTVASVSLIAVPFIHISRSPLLTYSLNQTDNQIQAVRYLQANVSHGAFVVTDMYAFIELRETMPKANYYWKVDEDPEISKGLLKNNWCNIDYLLVTPQLTFDAEHASLLLTQNAFKHSRLLATFSGSQWDVQVREVDKTNCSFMPMSDNAHAYITR